MSQTAHSHTQPEKEHVTFYTAQRVAKLAECVIQTIYRHLDAGKFPHARRIGDRKWLIPHPDVVAYLGYDPEEMDITVVR